MLPRSHTIVPPTDRGPLPAPHATSGDEIVEVTYYLVQPRWLFLKVVTRHGIVGWGEGTLEGRLNSVAAQLEDLGRYLAGADPDNIAQIHEQITRLFYAVNCPVLGSALSAIDIALWDIKGKRLGVPLHALFGGKLHDRVRTYHWGGGNVPTPQTIGEQKSAVEWFQELVARRDTRHGLFFKMNGLPQVGIVDTHRAFRHARRVLESLHDAFAAEGLVKIALDCHGRLDTASAREFLRMCEDFRDLIFFVEEPVPIEQIDTFRTLRDATTLKLATGERVYMMTPFIPLIDSGSVSIVQPDVAHCRGVTECLSIGRLAAARGIDTSFHCPNGPISLAASLHIKAVLRGETPQECSDGIHYNVGGIGPLHYLTTPSVLAADRFGFVTVPTGPGLGIDIDEEKVIAGCEGPLWDETTAYLYDPITGCPRAW